MESHALDLDVLNLHRTLLLNPVEERPRVDATRDAIDLDEERGHLKLLGVLERDRADRECQLGPAVVDADPADVEVVRAARFRLHHVARPQRRQRAEDIIEQ